MRIRRSDPDSNFTIIPNAALRDRRLSYLARGVLVELLSRPDGWETNADRLADAARVARPDSLRGEGRRALRAAFAELESAGYLIRVVERGRGGRVVTTLWLFDVPQDRGTAHGPSAGGSSVTGTPVTGTPVGGTSLEKTITNTVKKTDDEQAGDEHSATLAVARADDANARARAAEAWAQTDDDAAAERSAAAAARNARLHQLYTAVDGLGPEALREALLDLERRRPRIYRDCRQSAISQITEKDGAERLKRSDAAPLIDALSYKYAAHHYAENPPAWFLRRLSPGA